MNTRSAAAAIVLAAAASSSAQTVAPRVLEAPVTALSSVVLPAAALAERPLGLPGLVPGAVLGTPGPGVTPAHLEAVKALAEKLGQPVIIHGSRQTGVSHHTGLPFAPDTDLDTGLVGAPASVLSVEQDMWDGRVPHMIHTPMLTVPTVEEAVGRGHLVVVPSKPALPGPLADLQRYAAPLSTARQLSTLSATTRAKGEAFKFAVIGDAEPGRFWFSRRLFNQPGVFWKLLAQADAAPHDFLFQLGDMVSRGTLGRFWDLLRGLTAAALKTPFLTTIGNHDRHRPHGVTNDRVYNAAFGSRDYMFERGGWRFVVVDSSAGRILPEQLEWLRRTLDPKIPTVVFTHIPPAPLSEWTDWGALKGAGGFKQGAAEFMALMSANKVARVYMGHIHGLGALDRGGVRYVLTGGGGSPLFPGPVERKFHHWLSVEAGPNGITETVHTPDGKSFPLQK